MSIFDIVATLVLAMVLAAFAVQGTGELTQMQIATDDYIQCETLARQLQSGSDYLIEQVRMYTATGQREYNDAFTLLKSAMTASQNLSYTDRANPGESIFKDADEALYRVKQNGKHGCGFY